MAKVFKKELHNELRLIENYLDECPDKNFQKQSRKMIDSYSHMEELILIKKHESAESTSIELVAMKDSKNHSCLELVPSDGQWLVLITPCSELTDKVIW